MFQHWLFTDIMAISAYAVVLLAVTKGASAAPFNFAYGFWSPFGSSAWHPDTHAHSPPHHHPHPKPPEHPRPQPDWQPHHETPPTPTSVTGSSYTVYDPYTGGGVPGWSHPTPTASGIYAYGSATAANPWLGPDWTGWSPVTATAYYSTGQYLPTATGTPAFPTGYSVDLIPPAYGTHHLPVEPTPMTRRFEGPRKVKREPQSWGRWEQPQADGPHGGPAHHHGHGHGHDPSGGSWPTATGVWPTGGAWPTATGGWGWSQPSGYAGAPSWFPNAGPWPEVWEPAAENGGGDGDGRRS